MSTTESFASFIKENKKLVTEYFDLRLEAYKLRLIKMISKSAGYLIWTIVSLFLGFLLFTFIGLVIGFWMSRVIGSYTLGFGVATISILVIIGLLAIFRKSLFINPIIRTIIRKTNEEDEKAYANNN